MRFIGLDGLRGLMCLWVVVGHTVTMAGFNLNESQLSTKLLGQGLAVELFFIISGFVITLMFMNKNLPFKKYLSQRILRIFPVYLLFLLITAAMLPIALYALQNFPVEIEKTASRLAFTEVSINDFVKHFIPHLLMAHGLIPNAILDKTAYTIMGQAWSLTLQFQFFIIAPFLFVCFRKNQVIFYALILMALCVEPVFKATMGHGSFILANSKMFIVGILSAILLNHKISAKISHKNFAIALFFLFIILFFYQWLNYRLIKTIPILIWFSFICIESLFRDSLLYSYYQRSLDNRYCKFFGNISYSMYCSHMAFLYGISAILIWYEVDINTYKYTMIFLPFLLTCLASYYSFNYVEKYFINIGKNAKRAI